VTRTVLIAVAALVLAACGHGDHGGTDDDAAAGADSLAPAIAAAGGAAAAVIDMPRSYQFRPASLVIARGTAVRFTNSDVFTHAANVRGVGQTGAIRPGASAELRFDRAGRFAYDCQFHPQMMRGVVVVRD
jgi:plastocyanin